METILTVRVARIRRKICVKNFHLQKRVERDNMEEIGVDMKAILKYVLPKYVLRLRNGSHLFVIYVTRL